ncbi:serine hydrolase domain-containing protein [Kitasatospora sp. NPDC054939]
MIIRRRILPAALLAVAATTLPLTPAAARPAPAPTTLQQEADALRDTGITGVSVRVDTPRGARTARSGVADLTTRRPVPEGEFLRIGSITKTYVATVVLQLVGEGRLSLDTTVEELLPGTVTGSGNDGRTITLRDLLRHTSGLPEYVPDVFQDASAEGYFANRDRSYRPEQLVAFAMQHPPVFPVGTDWSYSNTNYVLAGMIIERTTGRTWEQEVERRILRPLGLRDTDTPSGSPYLPQPHSADYQQFAPDGPLVDTSLPYRPFDSGADGSMTGTARDVNRFLAALTRGRLLPAAQYDEMLTTVAVPENRGWPAATRDGLGVFVTPLSCGGSVVGHGGNGFGYAVRSYATADGRRSITVAVHSRPANPATAATQDAALHRLVDRALCAS